METLYAIYSVWTNWLWIYNLEDWKRWIYIYKNSIDDLKSMEVWDSIIFLQSSNEKAILFTFKEKNYTEWNDSWYVILNENDKIEFDISIWDFKNLSFINFDSLKSWVRSPLASQKNVLKLEKEIDIWKWFTEYDKLKGIFDKNDYKNHIREYKIVKNKEEINEKNYDKTIFCLVENNKFVQEFSYFEAKGFVPEWWNFNINFEELEKIYSSQNLTRLNWIKENNNFTLSTYSSYYDLTRVNKWLSNSKNKENIKKDEDEEINKTIEESEKTIEQFGKEKEEIKAEKEKVEKLYKEALLQKEQAENLEKEIQESQRLNKLLQESIIMNLPIKEEFLEWKTKYVENNKNLWYREFFMSKFKEVLGISKKNINYNSILPWIRISYLSVWQSIISKNDTELWIKKSQEMKTLVDKFDDIMEKEVAIAQKKSLFNRVYWLFIWEILLVFSIIFFIFYKYWGENLNFLSNNNIISFLSIIITATLAQIATMFYHIIKNLYPINNWQIEKLNILDSISNNLKKNNNHTNEN